MRTTGGQLVGEAVQFVDRADGHGVAELGGGVRQPVSTEAIAVPLDNGNETIDSVGDTGDLRPPDCRANRQPYRHGTNGNRSTQQSVPMMPVFGFAGHVVTGSTLSLLGEFVGCDQRATERRGHETNFGLRGRHVRCRIIPDHTPHP